MAYQPIEPVGLGRNVSAEMMKGGPRLQEEIKTMGPNTIKMIALQQIADQQKQKAMQANLQAQPNPATIVQQLEQQLGGMGQPQQSMGLPPMRDKAQQVGGALAQKQQQQQQNMQRAAQGQGRPMMAGGGLLSRPAPNIDPRYFEGGGIVAFAQGKEVRGYFDGGAIAKKLGISLEELERRIADQESRGLPREKAEQAMEQAAAVPSARKDFSMTEAYRQKLGMPEKEEVKKELTGTTEFPESPMLGNVGGAPKGLAGLMPGANLPAGLPPVDDRTKKVFEGLPEEKIEETVDVSVEEEVDVPKVSATGIDIPQSLKDAGQRPSTDKITQGLGALKTAGIDEEAAARTDYRKQMQLDPELKEEMNTMARRTKEREENYKPSRATTIREALAGAANRGSLGSVGAGISGAMSAREGDIQERKDSLFKARQDSLDKLVTRSDDIAKGALAYGADARKEFKADARTLVDAEVAMYSTQSSDARQARQQEADIAIANAGQQFKAEVENVRSTLKARADADLASYRKESNAIAREGNTATATKNKNTLVSNIVNDRNKLEIKIAEVIAERASALDSIETEKPESLKDADGNFDEAKVTKWKKDILDGMALQYAPILASYDALLKDQGVDMPERVAPKEEVTDEQLAADAVVSGV
jgi:hypothetical protein